MDTKITSSRTQVAHAISPLDYSLANVGRMGQLCNQYLFETAITTMCYVRVYRSGQMLYLSNDETWLNLYYNNEFFNAASHTDSYIVTGKENYYFWPDEGGDDVFNAAISHNMCYGFNLRESSSDYYETFIFNTNKEHPEVNNYYINHIPHLKKIIQVFKAKVLEELLIKPPVLYQLDQSVIAVINKLEDNEAGVENVNRLAMPSLLVDGKQRLSKREVECLYWTCLGKTADEIAMIMGLSKKTIESHFYNMKIRLNCASKPQLIHKVYQSCDEFKDLF